MLKKLVKRFEFKSIERSRIDLSGGLRMNPETNGLEMPVVPPPSSGNFPTTIYDMDQTLTARTWVANPQAVKAWIGFAIENPSPPSHPDPAITTPPYVIQFRLTDGSGDFYWDGAAWVTPTLDAHWNTEGDVATNISSFPIANRSLGVVVNMFTLHKSVTPSIKTIKFLYEADIVETYDLFYNSLIPDLKEMMKIRSRAAIRLDSSSDTFDLSNLKEDWNFDTDYNLTNVVSAYNHSLDENHLTNLLSSFDEGTKVLTLTTSVASNEILWVEFEYGPIVAINTSRDFSEVSSLPSIDISQITYLEKTEHTTIEDGVLNVDTGEGWKVPGPRVSDVSFTLEFMTDKQSDMHSMHEALRAWVSQEKTIYMRGMDEGFWIEISSGLQDTSTPNNSNIRVGKVKAMIRNVAFFERPAVTAKKLGGVAVSGGNLSATIP